MIHRHGMDDDRTAYEVEAALLDDYPGLINMASGLGNADFGARRRACPGVLVLSDLVDDKCGGG